MNASLLSRLSRLVSRMWFRDSDARPVGGVSRLMCVGLREGRSPSRLHEYREPGRLLPGRGSVQMCPSPGSDPQGVERC